MLSYYNYVLICLIVVQDVSQPSISAPVSLILWVITMAYNCGGHPFSLLVTGTPVRYLLEKIVLKKFPGNNRSEPKWFWLANIQLAHPCFILGTIF